MPQSTPRVRPYIAVSLFLGLTIVFSFLDYRYTFIPRIVPLVDDVEEGYYIRKFDEVFNHSSRNTRQLLLWTGYFKHISVWTNAISSHFKSCKYECTVTNSRANLAFSDAIMFHDVDVDIKDLPGMRIRHQPWIMFTMEPSSLVKKNYQWMTEMFNWTISYRNYSTILNTYGNYKERTNNQKIPSMTLNEKNRTAYAVISNCHDAGRRFKLIKEIKKYIEVDVYGRCGTKCAAEDGECLPKEQMSQYKFRLAFENSNCRDYVTEKYWSTLQSESIIIPVVNWIKGQISPTVVPGSYINYYDFNSTEEFAKYITKVSTNETLYQQYFQWKNKYTLDDSGVYCRLCERLHQPYQAQTYTDLMGWFTKDTCTKYSVSITAG